MRTGNPVQDLFANLFVLSALVTWFLSPFVGIYAAIQNDSFASALLSLFVPWYGLIYAVFS